MMKARKKRPFQTRETRDLALQLGNLDLAFDGCKLDALPGVKSLISGGVKILSQGGINSCTAHVICTAHIYAQLNQGVNDPIQQSRLFVYYNARRIEKMVGVDAGCSVVSALQAIEKYGVCAESIWPYDENKLLEEPGIGCYQDAINHKSIVYQKIERGISDFQDCINEKYPFCFEVTYYPSMKGPETRKTGMIQMPLPQELKYGNSHALVVVGYCNDYFIVQNSWGSGWGCKGYGLMPHAYIMNELLAKNFYTIRGV